MTQYFQKILLFCLYYLFYNTDVHPDYNPNHLYKPQCIGLSGYALHAQSLRGSFPSRAERTQAQTQSKGCGHCSHHVQQVQP